LLLLGAIASAQTPAPAPQATAPCGGDFNAWLQGVKTEAAAQGVSQRTIQSALSTVTFDPAIIAHDHAQGVFKQSFEQFSGRMIPPRLARAQKLMIQYGSHFRPGNGNFQTIRPRATLAFDCRRPDKFRGEPIAALKISDRGDIAPQDM